MNSTRLLCAALAALALAVPARAADDAKHTLRYKFQPGETLRWDVGHRARIKTTVAGTTQTVETVSTSVKAWQVRDVTSDGAFVFDHTVESVHMWQKISGSAEVRYNSKTDKEAPEGFQTVADSVGVPLYEVTMDATGQILNRKRNDKVRSAENEGHITIPLPEQPVAVGDTWSFPYQIDVPVAQTGTVKKVKTTQKYTLLGVKSGIATIRVATQILTPIHDPAIEVQLIQRQSSGTVRFDIDAGRVVGQQMDLDKQVVGFSGEASSLHYLTRFTEKFRPDAPQTAERTEVDAPQTK